MLPGNQDSMIQNNKDSAYPFNMDDLRSDSSDTSETFDTSDTVNMDENRNAQKRFLFFISCHGIEALQSKKRWCYSSEDTLFKDIGWISTKIALTAYASELDEKVFNYTNETNEFDLFQAINTQTSEIEEDVFQDEPIQSVYLPPMLFEFRSNDRDRELMAPRMGLYFAELEEENYTNSSGELLVKYATKKIEHLVHFSDLPSILPNVNIINDDVTNTLEHWFTPLDVQYSWQHILTLTKHFLHQKMESQQISPDDLNENIYFRLFCCRSRLLVNDVTLEENRSILPYSLSPYCKYYRPIEIEHIENIENIENIQLYSEPLDRNQYNTNIAQRIHDVCFYRNELSGDMYPINYDSQTLLGFYILMIHQNPYLNNPLIRRNMNEYRGYEKQTILSYVPGIKNSMLYKFASLLTKTYRVDQTALRSIKKWAFPVVTLPIENNPRNVNLCKSISNVLLQSTDWRFTYLLAYKNDPTVNLNEEGHIFVLYGQLSNITETTATGSLNLYKYNLDRNSIFPDFNQEQIMRMIQDNTRMVELTAPISFHNNDRIHMVKQILDTMPSENNYNYIHLFYKENIYTGGMNNDSLNKYNPINMRRRPANNPIPTEQVDLMIEDVDQLNPQVLLQDQPTTFSFIPAKQNKRFTEITGRFSDDEAMDVDDTSETSSITPASTQESTDEAFNTPPRLPRNQYGPDSANSQHTDSEYSYGTPPGTLNFDSVQSTPLQSKPFAVTRSPSMEELANKKGGKRKRKTRKNKKTTSRKNKKNKKTKKTKK
uniref:Uncharacterized protein n=1 Tax=viral metagenome TaxID=1070528 RepID=A0A6C0IQ47_9ZZZZ